MVVWCVGGDGRISHATISIDRPIMRMLRRRRARVDSHIPGEAVTTYVFIRVLVEAVIGRTQSGRGSIDSAGPIDPRKRGTAPKAGGFCGGKGRTRAGRAGSASTDGMRVMELETARARWKWISRAVSEMVPLSAARPTNDRSIGRLILIELEGVAGF